MCCVTGEKSKYRFSLERGELPIKFMGCPFLIKQHIYFECVNGPHHKSKENTDVITLLKYISKIKLLTQKLKFLFFGLFRMIILLVLKKDFH